MFMEIIVFVYRMLTYTPDLDVRCPCVLTLTPVPATHAVRNIRITMYVQEERVSGTCS
jgi:hypothetical protein